MIDYRALLINYMAGVIEMEGTSFVGACEGTEEERAELIRIELEVLGKGKLRYKGPS